MRIDELSYRKGTSGDARRCAALLAEAFETYRAFAPSGWSPPSLDEEAANLAERLDQPEVWSMLGEHGTTLVGHVAIMPAALHARAVPDPALAHFWQLFVARPWWGTGLATRLHARALAEAGARGFASLRLFTPARHARARRFYEREGWTLVAPPTFEDRIGFDIVEYRKTLAPERASGRECDLEPPGRRSRERGAT